MIAHLCKAPMLFHKTQYVEYAYKKSFYAMGISVDCFTVMSRKIARVLVVKVMPHFSVVYINESVTRAHSLSISQSV